MLRAQIMRSIVQDSAVAQRSLLAACENHQALEVNIITYFSTDFTSGYFFVGDLFSLFKFFLSGDLSPVLDGEWISIFFLD